MKKQVKPKPTGIKKSIKIQHEDGKTILEEKIINFPKTKEKIEQFVMDRFIRSWREGLPIDFIKNYYKNNENDFDFTIETLNGKKIYIDLMEIAILQKGGYDKAQSNHNVGEYVDFVVKNIMKKSNKYYANSDIFLLLYLTDDKFNLSNSILHCLSYQLNNLHKHVFHLISIVDLHVDKTDDIIYISHRNDTIPENEYFELRKNHIYNLTNFQLVTDNDNKT